MKWVVLLAVCVVLSGCNMVDVAVVETGQNPTTYEVYPAFVALYTSLGGEAALGKPITGVLTEQGRTVQYWAAVRMEVNTQTGAVSLSKLGDEMGYRTSPITDWEREAAQVRGLSCYPETGHTLGLLFADAYLRLGGPAVLGLPISEFTFEDGRFVQYFECARLDWYSELGPEEVRFGPLAQTYLAYRIANNRVAAPVTGVTVEPMGDRVETAFIVMPQPTRTIIPTPVPLPLRVTATVSETTLTRGRAQTLQVWVVDDGFKAVRGVPVRVVVHERYQDRVLEAQVTGSDGCATWTYAPEGSSRGDQVHVDAYVTWQGIEYVGRTSYMVW
jgi:hypothetical protein